MSEEKQNPSFFWTKVWGRPGEPSKEALLFNSSGRRDKALKRVRTGDVVVYLTSDATNSDPMVRGRVAGAVEIEGEPVLAEELGIVERARAVDFKDDGTFRWPYGITVSRTWRVLDNETNDNLISDHNSKGIDGAMTIHDMRPEEVARFLSLRVEEQVLDREPMREVFSVSLRRPWRQKVGARAGVDVQPGCDLYVAWIVDEHGTTFKVGSGKHIDRIAALNFGRRSSQSEILWSLAKGFLYHFPNVDQARNAEDYILNRAKELGYASADHSEFLVGLPLETLRGLYGEAIEHALEGLNC